MIFSLLHSAACLISSLSGWCRAGRRVKSTEFHRYLFYMNLEGLKDELRARRLSCTGLKHELLERIEKHDEAIGGASVAQARAAVEIAYRNGCVPLPRVFANKKVCEDFLEAQSELWYGKRKR